MPTSVLEPLLVHDSLCIREGLGGVAVHEATSSLAVLELGTVATANSDVVALRINSATSTAALGAIVV